MKANDKPCSPSIIGHQLYSPNNNHAQCMLHTKTNYNLHLLLIGMSMPNGGRSKKSAVLVTISDLDTTKSLLINAIDVR